MISWSDVIMERTSDWCKEREGEAGGGWRQRKEEKNRDREKERQRNWHDIILIEAEERRCQEHTLHRKPVSPPTWLLQMYGTIQLHFVSHMVHGPLFWQPWLKKHVSPLVGFCQLLLYTTAIQKHSDFYWISLFWSHKLKQLSIFSIFNMYGYISWWTLPSREEIRCVTFWEG